MTVSDVWNGDEPVCLGCSCLGFEASLTSAMCEEMTNRRYLEGNMTMEERRRGKKFYGMPRQLVLPKEEWCLL